MSPPAAWSQQTSNIRLVGFDYPPFYQKRYNALEGIAVDLAQELFFRLGLRQHTSLFPLKRALDMLRNGAADGTMILIKTPERSEYLLFSIPVMTVRGLIWSVPGEGRPAPTYDTLEDLRDYRIGVTRGYSYGPELDELLKTMTVDTANSDYSNYRKLLQGRIDIFPCNEIVARGLFREHPELRGKFAHSEKSFMTWVLRMAISKNSPYATLLPDIDATLTDMKEEGIVDRIVRQYTR